MFTNCPSELLLEIAHYVEDLHTLASVSRVLEDVASYVDFIRREKDLPQISIGLPAVLFANSRSDPPLWSWKRMGKIILPCIMTYTAALHTPAQARALLGFLSTPFTTCPCPSITVSVCNKQVLSLSDIVKLFHYCDDIGCGEVAIDLKDFLPQVNHCNSSPHALAPSNGSLRKINVSIPGLSERGWWYLFDHLTVPNLEVLEIVGSPHPLDLVKFLSRHQNARCLRLNSQQRKSIASTEQIKFGLLELEDISGPTSSVVAILGSLSQAADICKINFDCVRGTLYDIHASRIWNSLIDLGSLIKLELHIYPDFQSRLRYFEPSGALEKVLSLDITITKSKTEELDDVQVLV